MAAGIYFWYVLNARAITRTEATVLFWSTIGIGILLIIVAIWAVIRIFSYTETPVVTPVSTPAQTPIVTLVLPSSVAPTTVPTVPTSITSTGARIPVQVVAAGTQ